MKRSHSIKKRNIRLRRVFWVNFKKILLLGVVVGIVGGIGYFGVNKVLSIKSNVSTNGDETFTLAESKGEVLGISNVPAFPESTFLFEKNLDTDVVQRFLSQGKSAYLLPIDAQWKDVVDFYKEGLEENGWTHVLSVELADETRMFGEYWVKENVGLRIYTKLNDVWYELITVDEAKTGLSERIARENEIKMYLAMNSGEELPDNLPWKLEYSSEWTATIGKSKLLEIEYIQFDDTSGDQTLIIEPIEFVTQEDLKDVGVDYINEVNKNREEDKLFSVVSIDSEVIDEQEAYKFILTSNDTSGFYCVVANPKNDVIYVIRTYTGSESFFNYVIANLQVNDGKED